MSIRNEAYKADESLIAEDLQAFNQAITNCHNILGVDAFIGPNGSRSAPLSDALMYALMTVDTAIADCSDKKNAVKGAVEELLNNPKFRSTMDQGTNGRAKIEQRLKMAKDAVTQALADTET